jgi:hypothetical protein
MLKVETDRQQEKEKGVRSLNNGQSNRLPKSRRIASLQENNSAKVLVEYQMMPFNVLVVVLWNLIFTLVFCSLVEILRREDIRSCLN